MKIELTNQEKQNLELQHKRARDSRIADRIKAVLLFNEGWSQVEVSQALRIRPETVHDHLAAYRRSKKLKPENGGSGSLISKEQTAEILSYLDVHTFTTVSGICEYIKATYGVEYTVSGMTKWLHNKEFSYKKPKGTPAKADPEKQAAFIEYYENLLNSLPEDEPVEFGDGVHPTMATKITYGWIRTGTQKPILTTGSRTRINIMGSINLETMDVTTGSYETIDSKAMDQHFQKMRAKNPNARKIHLILDRGSYNTSAETKEAARRNGIILHYLPPYSPNLNPIERVWKVLNEHARNNRFFHSAKEFRKAIFDFFEITWPQIARSMVDRINDNFETIKQTS